MTWGFFKKLCVADVVAVYSDRVFNDVYSYQGFALVLAVFFFTVQIYCDFSGYSDIARGYAKLFGINLMENFRSPYFSASIREFWSRWHISLSTWFRDYVYIPLGGNRCSKLRRNVNLMITFIVSGLWHGANWTFLAWGAVHGVAQVIENAFLPKSYESHGSMRGVRVVITFVFVMLAWVFFRANTIGEAFYVYSHMFTGFSVHLGIDIGLKKLILILTIFSVLAVHDFISQDRDLIDFISSRSLVKRWTVYDALIVITFFMYTNFAVTNAAFVYFQF